MGRSIIGIANMVQQKVAIITGAASGIGRAAALALAERGYNLVINYSKSRAEAEQCQALCSEYGVDTLLLQGDVSKDDACKDLIYQAAKRWKRIDALINSAGVTSFTGLSNWDSLSVETFQNIYTVNAVGVFQLVRACAPHLKKNRGCIVNISSMAGILGRGSSVPYLMSKAALNALTLYLARALAPEVRVNAVCPGLVTSRWFREGIGENEYEKLKEKYCKETPLGRPNTPEDIAKSIVWLVEDANTVTGELLQLDAGLHLG